MQQKIIILDFGSQTTQLIGRRVRELDTFCEILPYNKFPKDDPSVIGVILSGSPYSVHDKEGVQGRPQSVCRKASRPRHLLWSTVHRLLWWW